jgi:hypothetical protein
MAKYSVRVYLSTFYDIEVEAESSDTAIEIAEDSDNWDEETIMDNLCVQENNTEVEEIEDEEDES